MNVSLMFVFSGNFYFETGLLLEGKSYITSISVIKQKTRKKMGRDRDSGIK